jgi:hypothetical protein
LPLQRRRRAAQAWRGTAAGNSAGVSSAGGGGQDGGNGGANRQDAGSDRAFYRGFRLHFPGMAMTFLKSLPIGAHPRLALRHGGAGAARKVIESCVS